MDEKIVSLRAQISGRVQGVGFRYWTKDQADSLGLVGYVRNLPNGDVEAVFEGEESLVNKMLECAHRGPAMAYVTEVKVQDQPQTGKFSAFQITF